MVVGGTGTQGSPELSPDGLAVYYRVPTDGVGEINLKKRTSLAGGWEDAATPPGLNTVSDERPGSPDATGTHLVITRGSPPASVLHELVLEGGSFVDADTLGELRILVSPINPQLSANGRTLVFGAMGGAGIDLFISERSNLGSPWPAARPISEVNTNSDETDPWLSADGRRLYFSRGGVIFLARK